MIEFKKPILAASLLKPTDEHTDEVIFAAMKKLHYPVLASLKKDGIRFVKTNDLRSRTLKLIPNVSIRTRAMKLPYGFDGELWTPELSYDRIESIVMSEEHSESDRIEFHLLDDFNCVPQAGYKERCDCLFQRLCTAIKEEIIDSATGLKFALYNTCSTPEELLVFEKQCIEQQGEGICFRTPDSPYKQGRSTLREQYLVKLSRFVREEVTVVGFEEQQENTNSEKRNSIGMMDRSSHKRALVGKNTLGAFLCITSSGIEVRVGTGVGLTDSLRKKIWNEQDKFLGKEITIKSKAHGVKVKPRSPIFVGFREKGY